MSGFEKARSISLQAATGADIPQYRFVGAGANGIALSAEGADSVGISLEMYDDSEHTAGNASNVIPVAVLDGAKLMVEAGAAVTAGQAVAADAEGRAIAATGTARVLGYAIEAAAKAGEFIQIVGSKGGGHFALA